MSLQLRSRPEYERTMPRPVAGTYFEKFRGSSRENEVGPEVPLTSLPILATANDARELVRFLNKRPNGVTAVEAMNAEPKRIFDARKIAAYEFWGIISRVNDRLNLTPLGLELAAALDPECRLHRDILHRIPAYQIAIRNIFDEGLDIATHIDVLRHWSGLKTIEVENGNAQDLEAAVVCFFSLCHAAELGTSTVGKRGQPARLRVDMERVAEFLTEGSTAITAAAPTPLPREAARMITALTGSPIRQVLVSTSGAKQDVDHLNSLLALAGFANSTVDLTHLENGLLPSSDLTEMQQCQAGIFVIRTADCIRKKDGTLSLRHEWITKISVAAALFDWKIILFWNGPLPPPEELSVSGLRIVSNEELDWEASLELVNQIKELAMPLSE